MKKELTYEQFLNFLTRYNIMSENSTDNASVLLHGVRQNEEKSSEQIVQNILETGLIIRSPRRSILSTAYLLNKPNNYKIDVSQFNHYVWSTNNQSFCNIVIAIPQKIGDFHLGKIYVNATEENGNSGLEYSEHCILDMFAFSHIPPEFIAGIIKDNVSNSNTPDDLESFRFIPNPSFYALSDENRQSLIRKLQQRFHTLVGENNSKNTFLQMLNGNVPVPDNLLSVLEKYKIPLSEYTFFQKRVQELLEEKHHKNKTT